MNKVKIELNYSGVSKLLKSEEMKAMLIKHANRIASSSGGKAEAKIASTRATARVRGDDGENGLLKETHK